MPKQEQSVHGYIAAAQRQGVSQSETMAALRGSGFRFSDTTFRSLWGEIANARDLRGAVADANISRRPLADEISQVSGGKIGEYLYRFDFLVRRKGETEVLRTHVGIKTNRLITFNNAVSQLLATWGENEDQYESEVVDWIPAAVNEFTG